jgi:hypothetical protein
MFIICETSQSFVFLISFIRLIAKSRLIFIAILIQNVELPTRSAVKKFQTVYVPCN